MSGNCLCLLVGGRGRHAIVLFLGKSKQVPGAWERIGIASYWFQPGVFTSFNSQPQTIEIV